MSARDEWRTPRPFFALLDAALGFTVDAAAQSHNALTSRYWTRAENGLAQDWNGERVWCNPPFSDVGPWVRKAHEQTAGLAVLLVPGNRTDRPWWHRWVEPHRDNGGTLRVRFLPGRVRYEPAAGVHDSERPTFGSALLVWDHDAGAHRFELVNVEGPIFALEASA